MLKLAPEGLPYLGVFFALTVISVFALGPRWALVPLVLMSFMVYFFRDPERVAPDEPGYISPADGRVLSVANEREDSFLKSKTVRVSIFMSPFNVHVNRAPCESTVAAVLHTPGRFRAAYRDDASIKNENTAMLLECDEGKPILVRQVAGFLARRTVCRVKPGDRLARGERFGMIKFSSRLDVYLPEGVALKVKPGDKVKAGETVLASVAQ